MTALKAHVRNSRIVVDEPVDLPDGSDRLNEAAGEVEILLVWNAVAGATPDL